MNGAHLHLLLNHIPIVGALLSLPILGLALWMPEDRGLIVAALVLLVASAVGALASIASGERAEEVVSKLPGIEQSHIETHEERADVAAGLSVVTALAGIGIVAMAIKRSQPVATFALLALLLLDLATAGAMAWTGEAGGLVRHTEIRAKAP